MNEAKTKVTGLGWASIVIGIVLMLLAMATRSGCVVGAHGTRAVPAWSLLVEVANLRLTHLASN